MESSITFVLIIWTIIFLADGTNYALQILHTPTEPGWTWSAVVTGTIDILKAQGIYLTNLFMFNHFTLENVTIALVVSIAVYGGPMAGCQIYKQIAAKRLVSKIKKEHDFNRK